MRQQIMAATRAGRRRAESLMVDECIIRRPTGDVETEGYTVTSVSEEVYAGKCKVGSDRPHETGVTVGGSSTVTTQRHLLHLPVASGPFHVGDVATITAAPMQPNLVGNVYRIAGPDERSIQTAQRMYVDIVGGGE